MSNWSASAYKNCLIVITGGTGAIQGRYCTASNDGTKAASVSAWAVAPDNTSTFAIIAVDAIIGATAPTASAVATAVWTDLISGSDCSTSASIGNMLKSESIDASIERR